MVTLVVVVLLVQVTTMDKVTYASDTTAAVPSANLSAGTLDILLQQETQLMVTLVVVLLDQDQQWIRSLMRLIRLQQFLVQTLSVGRRWCCRNRKLNSWLLWWWWFSWSSNQQWIRSLMHLIREQQFLVQHLSSARYYLAATGNSTAWLFWWW